MRGAFSSPATATDGWARLDRLLARARHVLIARGFRRRAPWYTRFHVDGAVYGGEFDAGRDPRLAVFWREFPDARRVLELGSLEGGHTFALAQHADEVVAIEGREDNLERARYCQRVLGVDNIRFEQADLETHPPSTFGRFDAVFCSGLLYHLPRPWVLLDDLPAAAPGLFLWTHFAAEAKDENEGQPGCWYGEHGLADPLSGLSSRSFWLTLPALVGRLEQAGFSKVDELERTDDHPHGPAILLAARA